MSVNEPEKAPDAGRPPDDPHTSPVASDPATAGPASVREQVLQDAERLRRAASLLTHGTVAVVVALHLGATVALTAIVFTRPFPYPFMYPLMGLLLVTLLGIRFVAVAAGRRAAAIRAMVTNLVMHAFFLYVLADQIPVRAVVRRSVIERPEQWVLLLPIALYGVAMAGMIVHGFLRRRVRRIAGDVA